MNSFSLPSPVSFVQSVVLSICAVVLISFVFGVLAGALMRPLFGRLLISVFHRHEDWNESADAGEKKPGKTTDWLPRFRPWMAFVALGTLICWSEFFVKVGAPEFLRAGGGMIIIVAFLMPLIERLFGPTPPTPWMVQTLQGLPDHIRQAGQKNRLSICRNASGPYDIAAAQDIERIAERIRGNRFQSPFLTGVWLSGEPQLIGKDDGSWHYRVVIHWG